MTQVQIQQERARASGDAGMLDFLDDEFRGGGSSPAAASEQAAPSTSASATVSPAPVEPGTPSAAAPSDTPAKEASAGSAAAAPAAAVISSELVPVAVPALKPRPTLYDLERAYLAILDRLDDGEEIPEADLERLAGDLERTEGAIEKKVEGWAGWIRQLELDGETAKIESDRLAKRSKSYERLSERLRENLKGVLIHVEKPKVKTPLWTVSVAKNPASVEVVDARLIPRMFFRDPPAPPKPEDLVDKKQILEVWKATKTEPAGVRIVIDRTRLAIK